MSSRFPVLILLACAAACTTERPQPALSGPLVAFLEHKPASLARCTPSQRQYAHPFWRAPYRDCVDSVQDGSQFAEIDADGVVVELSRGWRVTTGPEWRRGFEREAARLSAAFGRPVRDAGPGAPVPPGMPATALRSYCAVWRGPDSLTASLYLSPTTDVDPGAPAELLGWELRRYMRRGPLADAVRCGLAHRGA